MIEGAPGHQFDKAEFDRICREHLSGYKVPKAVFLAERVQRSPAGKADYRWASNFSSIHPAI